MVVLTPTLPYERAKVCSNKECGHIGIGSPIKARTSFYPRARDEDGNPRTYESRCITCGRLATREWGRKNKATLARRVHNYREKVKQDPEKWAHFQETRKRANDAYNRRLDADPVRKAERRKKQNEASRRRDQRLTPQQIKVRNENRRIAHRLRAEQRGRKLPDPRERGKPIDELLPIGPFRAWIEQLVARATAEYGEAQALFNVASALDVSERRLYSYRYELTEVYLGIVDRACSREGSVHVGDLYPETL